MFINQLCGSKCLQLHPTRQSCCGLVPHHRRISCHHRPASFMSTSVSSSQWLSSKTSPYGSTSSCRCTCMSHVWCRYVFIICAEYVPSIDHFAGIAASIHCLLCKRKMAWTMIKGQGHTVTKTAIITQLLVTMSRIPYTYRPLCYLRPLPAWVCMSIRLPMFSSLF